jgi:ADP-ribosyl-[dinitrogen reductase] hydrolase
LAINLGNDSDTTCAVYGQIAGACYGYEGIQGEWRSKIVHLKLIEYFADHLYHLAKKL